MAGASVRGALLSGFRLKVFKPLFDKRRGVFIDFRVAQRGFLNQLNLIVFQLLYTGKRALQENECGRRVLIADG